MKPMKRYWNALDSLPESYDLCLVLFEDGRTQVAWYTGQEWDSGRSLKGKTVKAWKKTYVNQREED